MTSQIINVPSMSECKRVYIEDVPIDLNAESGESSLLQCGHLQRRLDDCLPGTIPPKVIIKPNLCDIVSWEMGVTTDAAWLSLLAKVLRRKRSDVQIQVVESDAISAYRSFRSCDETYGRLGYREIASREGIELVNLSQQRSWEVAIPGMSEPLQIPEFFFEEVFYVSLANVKVHPYERFTGTLKNGLGLLPEADISRYHMRLPEVILALYRLCTPDWAIIDGRIGLEGKGPIIGNPKMLGKVIIGRDGLSVDEVACRLIGASPDDVPHLRFVARALRHNSKAVCVEGNTQPMSFEFDPEGAHRMILRKFQLRRFHRRFEQVSLRLLQWLQALKKEPLMFMRRAAFRLTRGNDR